MTETVRWLVRDSGFPNMKVLQFAFDKDDVGAGNDYLPHNYNNNCVVYTGTHDNETLAGWIAGLDAEQMELVRNYLDDHVTVDADLYKKMLNLAMMCAADTCIIPVQDYLGLDNSGRMNTPGTVGINWRWRMKADALTDELKTEIFARTKRYGRLNWANNR